LGNVTRWLGQQAEALGVEIFPGFPASEILFTGRHRTKAGMHFLAPALDGRARYPFAGWVSDLTVMTRRLQAIEAALARSGDSAEAVAELQARLTESQRNYRALRRSAGQVDPVVAEAVGALERDLDALRRATGLPDDGGKGQGGGGSPGAG
jgi:hypothetical protein